LYGKKGRKRRQEVKEKRKHKRGKGRELRKRERGGEGAKETSLCPAANQIF
jgi:hypothetical protein